MFVLDTMGNSLKSILFFKREGKKKKKERSKERKEKKKRHFKAAKDFECRWLSVEYVSGIQVKAGWLIHMF